LRKVIASELVSLDGVVGSPEKWHFPYFNDEMGEAIGAVVLAPLFRTVSEQVFCEVGLSLLLGVCGLLFLYDL
jgi:hypothetical protein